MQNFLTWKYWFTVNPERLSKLGFTFLVSFLVIFILLAIVTFVYKKKPSFYKRFFSNLYNLAITNIIINLLFLFFNYENIPFFSARFWLGIWSLSFLIWLFYILKELKKIPEKKKMFEAEREKKKYLP